MSHPVSGESVDLDAIRRQQDLDRCVGFANEKPPTPDQRTIAVLLQECDRRGAEIARLRQEAAEWKDRAERTRNGQLARIALERADHAEAALASVRAELEELSTHWHLEGLRIDSFHATMGTGFKQCAKQLHAFLLRHSAGGADTTKETT